ncbi:MAG: antitoxin [Candidatus Saccharibacteria bacterium]|nr:antitoxin [Candidatus Saccharibacteria bacterium]
MSKIIRKIVKPGDKPTKAQIKEIESASRAPITFDENSPEFTYEEMLEMIKMAKKTEDNHRKEIVTLRLSPSAIKKAKAVGKGYTGFLSRLIENALNDKDLVSRSL